MNPLLPVLIPAVLVMGGLIGTLSVRNLMHKRSPRWLRIVALLLAIVVMVIGIIVMVNGVGSMITDLRGLPVPSPGQGS